MSFFRNIKRLFGFGSEVDDEIYSDEIPEETPSSATPNLPDSTPAYTNAQGDIDPNITRQIFARVVEIVNQSLPAFFAESVDPEKQKQFLFDSLDASVKEYIASLDDAAMQRNTAIWHAEREKIKTDMDALRARAKDLEDKRSELKEKQLSADRQRRALSERVHDLEAQILKLEAEIEQLHLENTSLLNKMKVAAVYEQELNDLRQRTSTSAQQPDPEAEAQIKSLKSRIDSLEKELRATADERDLANKRAGESEEAMKAAKIKSDMADKMLSDIRNQSAEKTAIIDEKDQIIAQRDKTIAEKDAIIAEKDIVLADKDAIIADLPSDEELSHIQSQLENFAKIKDKLDARIARLNQSLKEARAENESLRNTIKNNLLQHAEDQRRLREELDALKAQAPQAPAKKEKTESKRRSRRAPTENDITEVQDVISDTDWLVSVPPAGQSMRLAPDDDNSFGYHAPAKKTRPSSYDPQPNLFDF